MTDKPFEITKEMWQSLDLFLEKIEKGMIPKSELQYNSTFKYMISNLEDDPSYADKIPHFIKKSRLISKYCVATKCACCGNSELEVCRLANSFDIEFSFRKTAKINNARVCKRCGHIMLFAFSEDIVTELAPLRKHLPRSNYSRLLDN